MVILEEPYASDMLIDWLIDSGHPVLRNDFSRSLQRSAELNMVDADEAARRIDAGERLYTNSENALSWIMENTHSESLEKGIKVFKDKLATRRALSPLDEGIYFRECSIDELAELNYESLPSRTVIKPTVGFCSMGVYVIESEQDLRDAVSAIRRDAARWQSMYPESVVDAGSFIVEEYIDGQEYAIDAYFDSRGRTHVLNVLKHDFSSAEDTSDRVYTTGMAIIDEMRPVFTEWLDKANGILNIRNFPFHVEVRVKDGHISPIEFNPLRFAGLGGTDVSQYAYGFKTYAAYLEDIEPDWAAARRTANGHVFTMSLLDLPEEFENGMSFDYDAFTDHFSNVREMREFDPTRIGSLGFLFAEIDDAHLSEIEYLTDADLGEFLN